MSDHDRLGSLITISPESLITIVWNPHKSRELRDYVRLPTPPVLPEQPCSKKVV
jgi:hypothetical protein